LTSSFVIRLSKSLICLRLVLFILSAIYSWLFNFKLNLSEINSL
jgi:hypothetical protein